jgi:uncharacterized UPF0160 family protein
MILFKKKKICVTHNGAFHADDLFATATLSILNNGNIKIIRTRDPKIFETGDYVYDVGGENDPERDRFDHHQKGGGGIRSNGIPYSSFGMIWKKYGEQICGNKKIAEKIDERIVQSVDAKDNGVDIYTAKIKGLDPYGVNAIFMAFYPTWKESKTNVDKIFSMQVDKIIPLLKREIKIAKDDIEGEEIIKDSYNKALDKRIIIIDTSLPRYLVQDILPLFDEPIYFVYPSGFDSTWKVEAVRSDISTMNSRKLFPESWRGLMNSDPKLKELSGISDFIFCHQSGFFAHTKTKEGAIKLAEKALIS